MVLLVAALLVASDPAVAASQSLMDPAPAQTAKPVKEKTICKVDDSDSYSRLRKRECHTQSEWDRLKAGVSAADLKKMGGR
jgi:hypothetical protein